MDKSMFVRFISLDEVAPLLHELTLRMQVAYIQRENLIKVAFLI